MRKGMVLGCHQACAVITGEGSREMANSRGRPGIEHKCRV